MKSKYPRYGLAAMLLAFLFSANTQAACEWSDRIKMDDAECLDGGWTNRTWPKEDTAWVESKCSHLGKLVAKIDRANATDWTVDLTGEGRVNRSGTAGNVRGIHCCSDLSELCNKSDIVNPDGCVAAFNTSEAYQGTNAGELRYYMVRQCFDVSATVGSDRESCSFDMTCGWWVRDQNMTSNVQVTVPYVDVPNLVLSRDGQVSVR